MKKIFSVVLVFCTLFFAACGKQERSITVISREEGSGTRSAFTELVGLIKDGMDNTYARAEVNSSTAVMIQTVAGNRNAIGYISLGALGNKVKALALDGVNISADAIQNGSYPLARPFFLASGKDASEQTQDFLRYVLSDPGQRVIREMGYVSVSSGSYEASPLQGTVRIAGSSSVAPILEKLAESYMALNPEVKVQIQISDSSTGLSALTEGLCDVAMSSRSLKESELAGGILPITICMDGIAVIVNCANGINGLTMEQLQRIFTGEITHWEQLG